MKDAWKGKSQRKFCLDGYGRHLHNARLRCIRSMIRKICLNGDSSLLTLIDLGCGEGAITNNISSEVVRVVGSDCLFKRVFLADELSAAGEKFIVSDILNSVFKDESADIALLHHVLEHFSDEAGSILRNCRLMLKKSGYLIVGVPNEDSFMGRLSRRFQPKLYAEGEHEKFYNEGSIIDLIKSEGFNPLSICRVGFLFPFYYLHILLISCKLTFFLGNFFTGIFRGTADSLIVLCRKE